MMLAGNMWLTMQNNYSSWGKKENKLWKIKLQ